MPLVVGNIRSILNDTHPKVQEGGIGALKMIARAIKTPEIADMADDLIAALSDSTEPLKRALDILLETNFVHAIDAPSLSLIIPILDTGLTAPDHEAKKKSARVVGHICALTSDSKDLLPYMEIILPAMKSSLFDSIPEIRASAAKAMGALSRGLGIGNSDEIIGWLKEQLLSGKGTSTERSGAAQGLAEVYAQH